MSTISSNNEYEDMQKYCNDIYSEVGEKAMVAAKMASMDDDLNYSQYVPMAAVAPPKYSTITPGTVAQSATTAAPPTYSTVAQIFSNVNIFSPVHPETNVNAQGNTNAAATSVLPVDPTYSSVVDAVPHMKSTCNSVVPELSTVAPDPTYSSEIDTKLTTLAEDGDTVNPDPAYTTVAEAASPGYSTVAKTTTPLVITEHEESLDKVQQHNEVVKESEL